MKRETVKEEIKCDDTLDAGPIALLTPAKQGQPAQAMPVKQ